VVVDAPFTKTIAGAFREAIQAEFKRSDFAFLINTHEHECHIGGNEAYADIPIVGHASVRRLMLADSGRVKKLGQISLLIAVICWGLFIAFYVIFLVAIVSSVDSYTYN